MAEALLVAAGAAGVLWWGVVPPMLMLSAPPEPTATEAHANAFGIAEIPTGEQVAFAGGLANNMSTSTSGQQDLRGLLHLSTAPFQVEAGLHGALVSHVDPPVQEMQLDVAIAPPVLPDRRLTLTPKRDAFKSFLMAVGRRFAQQNKTGTPTAEHAYNRTPTAMKWQEEEDGRARSLHVDLPAQAMQLDAAIARPVLPDHRSHLSPQEQQALTQQRLQQQQQMNQMHLQQQMNQHQMGANNGSNGAGAHNHPGGNSMGPGGAMGSMGMESAAHQQMQKDMHQGNRHQMGAAGGQQQLAAQHGHGHQMQMGGNNSYHGMGDQQQFGHHAAAGTTQSGQLHAGHQQFASTNQQRQNGAVGHLAGDMQDPEHVRQSLAEVWTCANRPHTLFTERTTLSLNTCDRGAKDIEFKSFLMAVGRRVEELQDEEVDRKAEEWTARRYIAALLVFTVAVAVAGFYAAGNDAVNDGEEDYVFYDAVNDDAEDVAFFDAKEPWRLMFFGYHIT